jgi:2-polyprenyl-3-methyl-5-hydroxy-6-metoxy-1,4-benzoquinol methylase
MSDHIDGDIEENEERFAILDTLYNFRTFRFLETTGIRAGWRCLEVGGGSGAVAAWMAERVGASGHVLVTDIDPSLIERSAHHHPANLEVRRHDIGTDPVPESAFDLIHARLVLGHVPTREAALTRLVAALKPRGWLVVEELDDRLVDRALPTSDAGDADRFRKVLSAFGHLMDEHGFAGEWPCRLYGTLRAAGLIEVGMEGHLAVREGGSPGAWLDATSLAQVRDRAVTEADADFVLARLAAPDFAVLSPVMFTAWGRRPA